MADSFLQDTARRKDRFPVRMAHLRIDQHLLLRANDGAEVVRSEVARLELAAAASIP